MHCAETAPDVAGTMRATWSDSVLAPAFLEALIGINSAIPERVLIGV